MFRRKTSAILVIPTVAVGGRVISRHQTRISAASGHFCMRQTHFITFQCHLKKLNGIELCQLDEIISTNTVDERNPANQLKLDRFLPIIYKVLHYRFQVVSHRRISESSGLHRRVGGATESTQ